MPCFTVPADDPMLLDALLDGTSQQHSKASTMGAHKKAAIAAFQTASWNNCLTKIYNGIPFAEYVDSCCVEHTSTVHVMCSSTPAAVLPSL
jgi:hypothetical protein